LALPAMLGAARLSTHLKQLPIRRLGATLLLLSGVWTASAPWFLSHGQHAHGSLIASLLGSDARQVSPPEDQAPNHLHHSP